MRVIKMLDDMKLCIVDVEVELGGELRHSPTLCAVSGDKVIPLNTPDGRPIFMNPDNAIERKSDSS